MRRGGFLLLVVLAAGVPRSAAAQEQPDTTRTDTARVDTTRPDTLPPDTLRPDTLRARPRPRYDPPRFAFSVTGGTLGFSDLQRQGVTVERLLKSGAVVETQSLRRQLTAEDGFQVGVSALVGLTPAWALRAGASWARASLSDEYSGEGDFLEAVRALPVSAPSDLSVLTLEGALRFRISSPRRIQPYAELGVAAVRMEADTTFGGAGSLAGNESSLAGLAAAGAVFPVRGRLSALFQLSGHFFRTPAAASAAGARVTESRRFRVTLAEPATGSFADPVLELARTFRLDVGVSIGLGSATGPRVATGARTAGSPP